MSKNKIAIGAMFAAITGFAAGLLAAPKSGKETREDIKDAALKTKGTVIDEAEKAKVIATQKTQEVKDKAEEVVADVRAKADGVVEEVTDRATELKQRAEQAVEGAKKGYSKNPNTKKK